MYYAVTVATLITMGLALVRALLGPSIYDRLLAANMFGTKTVIGIAVFAFMSGRTDLLDIALIYALISFVSVVAVLKLVEQGKVKTLTNVISDGGEEGWWVPKYLADKHPELKTIDGVLKNPDLVGKRFHNCPDGWGCRLANDNLKVAFELEKNGIEVFDHGSGETLATSIGSAYTDEKPWFGYYWGPTAILGKYPMVKVDMGPYKEDVHACNAKKECANPGKSSFPSAPVLTAVTTTFAEKNPEIVELMKNVSFTVIGINFVHRQNSLTINH